MAEGPKQELLVTHLKGEKQYIMKIFRSAKNEQKQSYNKICVFRTQQYLTLSKMTLKTLENTEIQIFFNYNKHFYKLCKQDYDGHWAVVCPCLLLSILHPYLLPDVFVSNIAGTALGDEAGPLAPGAAAIRLVLVLCQASQEETIREETLPGQHGAEKHTGKSVLK